MTLETVELQPDGGSAGTVVWLHGLGADGHDFEPIVPMLELDVAVRFVFPHAPVRPVTINGGMEMRAWYDIDPRSPLSGSDDIRASGDAIEELVLAEEGRGVPRSRIVLAGFSQGGVVALHLALRSETRFAGVMALSTYVHDHENLADLISFASIDTPIFMAHGQMDPMIPITRAITSREALVGLGYDVEWHEYGMGHEVCPQEIADIARWLDASLS
ncbi:MAG: carboxylesterase [Gammaproteobacteria bacterium]|nr:carboxylesterase [Gammaproteobacteria bacterium]MYK45882.1 carboxylesterase [Gammaproteobacteria bacterium]